MPKIFYQQKTEPTTAGPESTTVDRWLSTWVQPLRPLLAAGMFGVLFSPTTVGPVAPVSAPSPPVVPPISAWQGISPVRISLSVLSGAETSAVVRGGLETTTVDRYQPTYPQPLRPIVYATGTVTREAPVFLEPPTADRVAPTYPQPSRVVVRASGTDRVDSLVQQGELTTVDRYQPTYPQPIRSVKYAAPTPQIAPVLATPETTTADRWAPIYPQPGRPVIYAATPSTVAPIVTTREAPTIDRFGPHYPQPLRPIILAKGTDLASPIITTGEAATVDRFAPTYPQPSRFVGRAVGSTDASPVSLAVETVTADRWLATFPQPLRSVVYATSSGAFNPVYVPVVPAPIGVSGFGWYGPQPKRTVVYAAGTTFTGPVAIIPNPPAPIGVGSFGWHGPQPVRSVVYAAGTTLASPTVVILNVPDMMAAVVNLLRATPAVISALNEDTSAPATTKIWADNLAQGQPDLPYLTYSEPRGTKEYVTGGGYLEWGTFDLSVFTTGKLLARTLGGAVIDALNDHDADLRFLDGFFGYIREQINAGETITSVGPGTSNEYKRIITMKYMVVGSIQTGAI